MTLLMRDQENQEIGKKIGEIRVRTLVEKLIADGRFGDVEKMVKMRNTFRSFIRNMVLSDKTGDYLFIK